MIPIVLLSLGPASGAPPADVWPGFRGDGSSIAAAGDLPLEWSPIEHIAWRRELPGYGQSSPVVWKGRIFVTAVAGAEKERLFIVAIDLRSGAVAWKKEWAASRTGKNNPVMSRAAPTPVVDGDAVYCLFESGDLVAYTHDGGKLWERSLAKDHGEIKTHHGLASSPAQFGRSLFVQIDHAGPSYLVAIDKATGQDFWKTERPAKPSWSSPVVVRIHGAPAVVAGGGGALTAYDAKTGRVLATLDGLVGNTIPSPVVAGDCIVVGAGEGRSNPDPVVAARSNCAVRIATSGAGFETIWQGRKAISHHASPLVHRGHVYLVTRLGIVYCLDLKTGAERFAERLDDAPWTTPIGAGEYVYFFGKSGVTTVLKAGPEFEKVVANRLWSRADYESRMTEARKAAEKELPPKRGDGATTSTGEERDAARYSAVGDVVYGVAVADGAFIIRCGTELVCVRRDGRVR